MGWFEGFRLIMAVNPSGVITGFAFSEKEQLLGEDFLLLRRFPHPRTLSVGMPAFGVYVVDSGFEGKENHKRWYESYGAKVICKPRSTSGNAWPKNLRRWFARIRQIVETVYEKLINWFNLGRDRPHDIGGFHAHLAAKMALHNFCIWLNLQLGRARLAFANLVDW